MQLVLVHHGAALSAEADPLQPLSPAGRARVDRLAVAGADRGVKPETIWHSGKLRARQTADAWWRACNPFAEVRAIRGLQPGESARLARTAIDGETRDAIVVGHLPHLSRLLSSLLTGDPDAVLPFPEHGAVALTRDASGQWAEAWRVEG